MYLNSLIPFLYRMGRARRLGGLAGKILSRGVVIEYIRDKYGTDRSCEPALGRYEEWDYETCLSELKTVLANISEFKKFSGRVAGRSWVVALYRRHANKHFDWWLYVAREEGGYKEYILVPYRGDRCKAQLDYNVKLGMVASELEKLVVENKNDDEAYRKAYRLWKAVRDYRITLRGCDAEADRAFREIVIASQLGYASMVFADWVKPGFTERDVQNIIQEFL